jgi:alpha-galactosidase
MDITRKDVRDYIVDSVNKVIRENEIDYVKWDFNRNATEFYSVELPSDRQKEFSHRYALGLYELCERIVEANPDIIFEGCSGGGARFDPAILYYFPQIWTSDNSDAEARTLIQYVTSYAYPLSSMSCHVSVTPNHQTSRICDMKTRSDIAHLGATGYELDTSSFTDEDREEVKAQVLEYKAIEELVLFGDLYRIENPHTGNYFSFMLVSKDKSQGFLTAYRRIGHANGGIYRIKAKGLDPKKKYYVTELGIILGGDTLMNVGLVPDFKRGDFQTVTFHFEEK